MTPKKQGLTGLFVAVVVALPLFVFSAINVNYNLNEKAEGEPNFCGGTCGSNYNCQANFFCFEGFCRNPVCSSDTDCICNIATMSPTPSPTISTKSSPKPTVKPSPTITAVPKGGNFTDNNVVYDTPLPLPNIIPSNPQIERESDTETIPPKNIFIEKFLPYILGSGILILIIGLLIYKAKKYIDNKKPHILPPTNI